MSTYKHFAVIGAGNIGGFIINELVKAKATGSVSSVVVITRSNDTAASYPQWVSEGVKFATIDYDNASTIAAAFEGIDVVISTVGGPAITKQQDLGAIAKAGSVKLFIPSEFGNPTVGVKGGRFALKSQVQEKLKELGLPYCLVFNGPFPDFVFHHPGHGWDGKNGTFNIGGDGTKKISFTARPDIARFLVHALTTLPASQLEWKIFRLEGDRTTFNEIVEAYEAKTGKKLQVTHTPRSELEAMLEKDPEDFITRLRLSWDNGGGVVGDETDNNLWPDWNPKKVLDILLE